MFYKSFFGDPIAQHAKFDFGDLYQISSRLLEESLHLSYWMIGVGAVFIALGLLWGIGQGRKKCMTCRKPLRGKGLYCSHCGQKQTLT